MLRASHWAQRWLQLVVKYQHNPLRAARSIAYTHVAMRRAYLQAKHRGGDGPLCELSAHRAASLVLQHFYPNETPGHLEAQYAWMQSQLNLTAAAQALAQTMGTQIATEYIERQKAAELEKIRMRRAQYSPRRPPRQPCRHPPG